MDRQTMESADRYEKEYTFMALNAVIRDVEKFQHIHADWMIDEVKLVHDELLRRGLKIIKTEEEYKAGVAKHGVPPAFQQQERKEEMKKDENPFIGIVRFGTWLVVGAIIVVAVIVLLIARGCQHGS